MLLIAIGFLVLLFGGVRAFAVVNTGLTAQGIKGQFFERYEQVQADYPDLTTRIESKGSSESHRWLGSIPQMREWGNGRLLRGIRGEKYDLENQRYEASIEVDRIEHDDDQTGQIRVRINELAEAAKTHPDYLLDMLVVNGASAGFLAYDGKVFFPDDHESGQSGAQSNIVQATAVDPENPTAPELRSALALAIARMMGFKDDAGRSKRIKPTGLVVQAPATLYIPFMEALNQTLVAVGTEPLQKNVLQAAARVISGSELSTSTRFFVYKTDSAVRPFIFQDRDPIEFAHVDSPNDTGVFKSERYMYGVRARYAMGYGEWRYALQVDLVEPD